jgi:hypothetical protein
VVGSRIPQDRVEYVGIDLVYDSAGDRYTHRDGTPYPQRAPSAAAPAQPLDIDTETLKPRVYRHE